MKKFIVLASFLTLLITACAEDYNTMELSVPAPADYTSWDQAIRVDTDLQTMYANTPRKIQKPIDMYMAFALALKYNYTRRLISYQQSMIEVGM